MIQFLMGQENFGNITVKLTFQVVCYQHLTFVRNSRSVSWEGGVTMSNAFSGSPPSVRMLLTSGDIQCARVFRSRDQMMAVSGV